MSWVNCQWNDFARFLCTVENMETSERIFFDAADGAIFDLVCPSCGKRCIGQTRPNGSRGTYLVAYVRFDVHRVICQNCGYIRQASGVSSLNHRYWYRIRLGRNQLWAENESRLRKIRALLEGQRSEDRFALHALPRWLLVKASRKRAVSKIDKLLNK